jgi:molecular chaperone HtpG
MKQQRQIQINLPGLLRMLGENIYAEPDVAIREMIQNAHDTCIIRSTQDGSFKNPQIHIGFNKADRTITIADNGAGMTEKDLDQNLSTIGESFTRIQRDQLREKDAREAALLIGQFGIGLLSAFSISKQVEIFTRAWAADQGFRWVCEGDIHYTVEQRTKPEPGTRVILHLLDSKLELLDESRLRLAIKKYADFLSVPIFLNNAQANACTPPWETEQADLSEYIQKRWDLLPLGVIPFNTEILSLGPTLPDVSGLLFVPLIRHELSRHFGEVDIYISRMFIKANDKDLLPRWASFVKGVINTPDLTPTLSRGEIIADTAYNQVRELLGKRILAYLDLLRREDPDKLSLLVGIYNNTIKAQALEDDDFFERICDLVRVSTDSGYRPLCEYLENSGGVLYYFDESGTGTQHKVLLASKGLPVIDASWGVEEEFLERYAARRNVRIERLSASSGAIFKILDTADKKWQDLERDFHMRLRKAAKAVEFEPVTVPAVLVAQPLEEDDKQLAAIDSLGTPSSIKQMFHSMAKRNSQREAGESTILHLNTSNPLIRQLREMPRNETFDLALTCIYNNAVIFNQHYVTPDNAEIIFASNNAAFAKMIQLAQCLTEEQQLRAQVELDRDRLKRQMADVHLTAYRSCFFAFDYKIEDNYRLLDAIQEYFDHKNLGIKVMAPANEMEDLNIHRDLHRQLKQAHFGIAEISNNNLNVLYESGLLHGMGKPLVLLQHRGSTDTPPFDIFSDYRCQYEVSRRESNVRFTWLEEELDKAMNTIRRMLPTFDTVPLWDGKQMFS